MGSVSVGYCGGEFWFMNNFVCMCVHFCILVHMGETYGLCVWHVFVNTDVAVCCMCVHVCILGCMCRRVLNVLCVDCVTCVQVSHRHISCICVGCI